MTPSADSRPAKIIHSGHGQLRRLASRAAAATTSCTRFCAAAWPRSDGADPGRTRFGDDLGNGAMVARRHDVSAAYRRDLREFLQQFDTNPLSLGFRVAVSVGIGAYAREAAKMVQNDGQIGHGLGKAGQFGQLREAHPNVEGQTFTGRWKTSAGETSTRSPRQNLCSSTPQVRRRLAAGAKEIRTPGPSRIRYVQKRLPPLSFA